MTKQTFTTGQVLTAAQMTSLQQTAMGGGSTTAKTASYTLVAADAGTVVQMNSASATTITVNTALFAAGDSVQIQNVGAGVCTVTAGTATVSTAGSLALSQYEGGQLYFNTTSAALFFDIVQSASAVVPILTTAQPTGDFSTASTSFVDITNVTITRTPVSATNKIEVKFSFVCTVSTGLQLDLKCLAGATSLLQFSYEVEYNGGSPDTINAIWYATNVAASSTIFKVQAKVNTGTITFNGTNSGYANGFSTLEVY